MLPILPTTEAETHITVLTHFEEFHGNNAAVAGYSIVSETCAPSALHLQAAEKRAKNIL